MPFLTKKLSREIMTRSKLRSNYLKHRNEENKTFHVKQRNCVSLLPKSKKKKILRKLTWKKHNGFNKLFWEEIKPSLSDRLLARGSIYLTQENEMIKSELEMIDSQKFFCKCNQ